MDFFKAFKAILGLPVPEKKVPAEPKKVENTEYLPLAMCPGRCAVVEIPAAKLALGLAYSYELERFNEGLRAAARGDRRN